MATKRPQVSKAESRIIAAYRECFGTEAGALVLEDLKDAFYRQPYGKDSHDTAFRCGSFEVVGRIMDLVKEGQDG
jgi:hypothetical protein